MVEYFKIIWLYRPYTFTGVDKLGDRSKALRALCTTRHIRHRGDTLNKPTVTVEISSPGLSGCSDVLELKAYHFQVSIVFSSNFTYV